MIGQWDRYADKSSGISIGFSSDYLKKECSPNEKAYHLAKVVYEEKNHQLAIDRTISAIEKLISQSDSGSNVIPGFIIANLHVLWMYAAICKSIEWRVEQEWRVIRFPGVKEKKLIRYHQRNNKVVPYLQSFKLVQGAISKIILGPHNKTKDDEVAKKYLQRFLENSDFNCDIKESEITLRNV